MRNFFYKNNKKAIVNVEFIVSVVIFLVVIVFVMINTFNLLPIFHGETVSEDAKSKLYQFSELLLDEGYPTNWSTDATNTKRFGLSSGEKYVLNPNKISVLNNLCETNDGYGKIRDSFGENDIKIVVERLDGTKILDCEPKIKQLSRELYIDRFAVLREPLKADGDTLLLLHFDNSYNGENGEVPAGTPTTSFRDGVFNQAVSIGSGSINGTLSYPSPENINQTQGTIEMWVRPNWNGDESIAGNYYFFDFRPEWYIWTAHATWNTYRIGQLGTPPYNEPLGFRIADQYSTLWTIYSSLSSWNAGDWHCLAATWKNIDTGSANGEMHFYVDGVEVGAPITNTNIQLNETPNSFYIGSVLGNDRFADAIIDEVRISDIPRTYKDLSKNCLGEVVRIRVSVFG